ncbi:FimV/HubP family polar landmark protein [Shewanella sp. 30m-9]
MNFRTSHLVGLIATGIVAIAAPSINSVAAEPLKITGPDGQVKQSIRQYGPTTSQDTFWSIAQAVKPDNSVTVYQVMSALYDANPHAFSSKNYNSLERGMILLVPNKAVIQQTSQADAKARAERNDRKWSPSGAKPSIAPKTVAAKIESPQPSVVAKTPVSVKPNPLIADLSAEVEALTRQMEAIQAKNLELTDELARASDEIVVGSSDTAAFQDEINQLKEENALLKQALQDSKSENEALNQEVQLKQKQLAAFSVPKQEPASDLWRTIMDNPLLLVLGGVLPALLVVVLFWLFIRRRNDANAEEQQNQDVNAAEKPISAAPEGAILEDKSDDAEGLAVHLDTDDASNIDPLTGAVAATTVQAALAEEQDIIVEDSQDEGQSLDDLWAEAMGEQDLTDTDEFDAFNSTATTNDLNTTSSDISDSKSSDEDDLDSLLAGFDVPAEDSFEQPATNSSDDDLDALLAGFDNDDSEVVQLESGSNADTAAEDDLDALLAGFNSDNANDEIQSSSQSASETGTAADSAEDDLDALLASFGESVDDNALDTKEDFAFDAEVNANTVTDTAAEDDIDALLAGIDETPTEPSSTDTAEDDIDALLAGFDSSNLQTEPVFNTDTEVEDDLDSLLAELEGDDGSQEDSNEIPDIDALSDEMAAELELGFEIAAELDLTATDDADQEKPESELDSELNALLADLEAPSELEQTANVKLDLDEELALAPDVELEQSEELTKTAKDSNSLDFDLTGFDIDGLNSSAQSTVGMGLAALKSDSDNLDADADTAVTKASERKVSESKADDMLEFTLPEVDVEPDVITDIKSDLVSELETAVVKSEKESGFFDDLKGDKKTEANTLDWESIANQSDAADEALALSASAQLSDDELLSRLAAEGDSQDQNLDLTEDDDAFSLDDSKMTVDEALAALDAEELGVKELDDNELDVNKLGDKDLGEKSSAKSAVAMHDLTTFQKDNGFIDIDMLLSEADEDSGDTDLYKELDVDMGELDSLMGNSPMVDVDDEENSVNAKLDLARAYIEIDDNDSARALLKEVELDGNDRQQAEAMGLLNELV